MTHENRVIFLPVREPKEKVVRLVETVQLHFAKKEHLLIFVEDEKAQHYVDELLWKFPETSFLPHVSCDQSSSDWLVITREKKNLNGAQIAFNLCSTPLLIEGPFRIIYDFEDMTHPNKKSLSSMRFDAYKKSGLLIESR